MNSFEKINYCRIIFSQKCYENTIQNPTLLKLLQFKQEI